MQSHYAVCRNEACGEPYFFEGSCPEECLPADRRHRIRYVDRLQFRIHERARADGREGVDGLFRKCDRLDGGAVERVLPDLHDARAHICRFEVRRAAQCVRLDIGNHIARVQHRDLVRPRERGFPAHADLRHKVARALMYGIGRNVQFPFREGVVHTGNGRGIRAVLIDDARRTHLHRQLGGCQPERDRNDDGTVPAVRFGRYGEGSGGDAARIRASLDDFAEVDERLPLRCRERRGRICVFGGRRIGERYGERAVVLAEVFIRELHLDGIDARVYHRHRKFDGNVPASGDDVGRAQLGARRCDSRRGARRGGRTLRSHGDECLVFRTEYNILDVQPRDLDVRRRVRRERGDGFGHECDADGQLAVRADDVFTVPQPVVPVIVVGELLCRFFLHRQPLCLCAAEVDNLDIFTLCEHTQRRIGICGHVHLFDGGTAPKGAGIHIVCRTRNEAFRERHFFKIRTGEKRLLPAVLQFIGENDLFYRAVAEGDRADRRQRTAVRKSDGSERRKLLLSAVGSMRESAFPDCDHVLAYAERLYGHDLLEGVRRNCRRAVAGVHRRDRAARIRNGGRTGAYLGNGDKGALVVAVSVAGEYQCPAFKLGGKP